MFRNLKPTTEDEGVYCTYLFEREALRFLENHASKDPFFLYVPFNAPHGSSALEPGIRSTVQAPDEFKKRYPAVDPETREVARFRYASPAKVATREARQRDYRAAVTCMDASIGKMLDLLQPIYQQTAAYGHFGREDIDLPWERTDKADALREAAGQQTA